MEKKKQGMYSGLSVLAQVYKSYLLKDGGPNLHSDILPKTGRRKKKKDKTHARTLNFSYK